MDADILKLFPVDTRWVRSVPAASWRPDQGGMIFLDPWRVPWRKADGSAYYDLQASPLKGMDQAEVLRQRWDLLSDASIAEIRAQAAALDREGHYPVFTDALGAGIFEQAISLRGFEDFITELMVEERFACAFMDGILEAQLSAYDRLFDAVGGTVRGVLITDDLATQDSLMLSPDAYRRLVKPRQKVLFDRIHARGAEIVYHTCGAVKPLLPDLIEIGVRVLHPVQTSARDMEPAVLKREFGRDLAFWGGGCDTRTLQFGTEAEVEREVRTRIDELAPGGGFVFTTTHCIQPGTPPRNLLAMIRTLRDHGGYR